VRVTENDDVTVFNLEPDPAVRFKLRLRAGMVIEASRWNANLPQPDLIAPLRQAARSCCLGDVSVLLVRIAHLVVGCLNRSHPRS
jgi:hypothetical protein